MTVSITDDIGVVMGYPKVYSLITSANTDDTTEATFNMMIGCIDSIYDDKGIYKAADVKFEELKEFVESLNSKQFQDLAGAVSDMPKLVLDTSFSCKKCDHSNEMKLEGIANFF